MRRRVCEERILTVQASSARQALAHFKRKGRGEQFSYPDRGKTVFFEFVGVMQLVALEKLEPDQVWWDIVERFAPMERRKKLIPPENELCALRSRSPRYPGRLKVG